MNPSMIGFITQLGSLFYQKINTSMIKKLKISSRESDTMEQLNTRWCPKAWGLGLLNWMREFRAPTALTCYISTPLLPFHFPDSPFGFSVSKNPPVLLSHLSGKGVVGKWSYLDSGTFSLPIIPACPS